MGSTSLLDSMGYARAGREGRMPNLYEQPAIYQMLFDAWSGDLPFYRRMAAALDRPEAEILLCGVGTGWVAIALASLGHRVFGVDVDEHMLHTLAARTRDLPPEVAARITFERADVRTMSLGRRFSLVTAPFNGIAHQHARHELLAFLAGVRRHLAPSGRFAFDTWTPDASQRRERVSDSPRFRDPRDGSPVRCTETIRFDVTARTLAVTLEIHHLDRDEPETLTLALRVIDPGEMHELLEIAGFEVVEQSDLGEMIGWTCR
jgi:SAM-dependent methyltransferase